MAKVWEKGREVEGRSVVTEAQAAARNLWDDVKSSSAKAERVFGRQMARATRSAEEQLKLLDQRIGAGQGAVKERARLSALVSAKK